MALLFALLAGLTIMAISLAGVLTTRRSLGNWTERNLKYLVSFSSGVFFIVALELARETLALAGTIPALLSIGAGGVLMAVFSWLLPESHHHHEMHDATDTHDLAGARRILLGDSLHNIGDGLLLAPAFLVNVQLGIATTIGILVHETIQEISEFFVLRESGYTNRQALLRNFLVSGTVLIGIFFGFFLSNITALVGPLLGLAAGAFFFIVFHDLLPRSVATSQHVREYATHALVALLGVMLMLLINTIHTHGAHEEHESTHPEMTRAPISNGTLR